MDPRPKQTLEALNSEAAADQYDQDIRIWGETGWKRVNRLCWWAKDNGMKVDCPPRTSDADR